MSNSRKALQGNCGEEIQKDYRHVDTSTVRVMLVEANDRVLKSFHPSLRTRCSGIVKLGVEVRLNGQLLLLTNMV